MVSYKISRFPVPVSVFSKIQAAIGALDEQQRSFVLHVLVSNLVNLNKVRHHGLAGWLEVSIDLPCQWIEEHFGRTFKATDIDPKIVSVMPHHIGQCRSYKVADELLDAVLEWNPPAAPEPIVNLFDGSPYEVRTPTEREDGIFTSKIMRKAMRTFESCPFNYAAIEDHLAGLAQAAKDNHQPEEQRAKLLLLANDKACANRIRGGCAPVVDGFSRYQPEFRSSKTGRIIEVGGGSQSCSREMKAVMFEGIPDLRNYDLKRAQAFILLQELEDAGLPREWVERYVSTENVNEERAMALGMRKDAYKGCLYATIMGATHSTYWNPKKNDIYKLLLRECGGHAEQAKALAKRVYGALAPLKAEVEAWHRHLMNSPNCLHVDPIYKKVRTLKNACGQHFNGAEYRKQDVARKAAAFVLQGQEGAFVHHLTLMGKENGFTPISNQHDGLVVIGKIPKGAVEEAAKKSGLRYATMETKAFV